MKQLFRLSAFFFLLFSFGFIYGQVITTFEYTGDVQTFTVPFGVTSIQVEAFGAEGDLHVGIMRKVVGGCVTPFGVTPFLP